MRPVPNIPGAASGVPGIVGSSRPTTPSVGGGPHLHNSLVLFGNRIEGDRPQDHADFEAFKAALQARLGVGVVNINECSFSVFDGITVLSKPVQSPWNASIYGNASDTLLDPMPNRLWFRSLLGASSDLNLSVGGENLKTFGGLADGVDWNGGVQVGIQYPDKNWQIGTYAVSLAGPNAVGDIDSMKAGLVSHVFMAEGNQTNLWIDGQLRMAETVDIPAEAFIECAWVIDSLNVEGAAGSWYMGLYEFVNGDIHPDPYGLL